MKTNASSKGMKVTKLPDDYRDEPRVAVRSELVIHVHVGTNGKDVDAECTPQDKGGKKVFKNGWIHYPTKDPVLLKFVLHAGEGIATLAFMNQQPIVAGTPSTTAGSCAKTHDLKVFDGPTRISDSEASVAFRPDGSDDDRAYVLNVRVKLKGGKELFRGLDPRIINKTVRRRPGPAYP